MNWGSFFLRRFLRLYPTYAVALCAIAVIDAWLARAAPALTASEDRRPATFILNLLGLEGIAAPHYGSASVFWTLVLEMHLYLAYPLLFWIRRRWSAAAAIGLALGVSIATLALLRITNLPGRDPLWHAGGPIFTRYWFTWAIGFYIAEVSAGSARAGLLFRPGTVALCVLAGIGLTVFGQEDFADLFLAVGCGWIILRYAIRPPGASAQACFRVIAPLGIMSYSLYCIHVPLLLLTLSWMNPVARHSSLLPAAAGILVAILGAALLYGAVEHPSIRWSRAVRVRETR